MYLFKNEVFWNYQHHFVIFFIDHESSLNLPKYHLSSLYRICKQREQFLSCHIPITFERHPYWKTSLLCYLYGLLYRYTYQLTGRWYIQILTCIAIMMCISCIWENESKYRKDFSLNMNQIYTPCVSHHNF